MPLAARATERHKELLSIVNWLDLEARRFGVDVRLNTFADAAAGQALDPDTVIIASGGLPATPTLSTGRT